MPSSSHNLHSLFRSFLTFISLSSDFSSHSHPSLTTLDPAQTRRGQPRRLRAGTSRRADYSEARWHAAGRAHAAEILRDRTTGVSLFLFRFSLDFSSIYFVFPQFLSQIYNFSFILGHFNAVQGSSLNFFNFVRLFAFLKKGSFFACFHFRNCNRIAHRRPPPPHQSAPASAPPPPVRRSVLHQQQHQHQHLRRPLPHCQLHRSRSREPMRGRVARPPLAAALARKQTAVCFQAETRMATTNQARQTATLVATGKRSTFKNRNSSNNSSGHPAVRSTFATRIHSRPPPLRPPPSPPLPPRRRPVRSISALTARRARDHQRTAPPSLRSALCRASRRYAGGSDAVNHNHRKDNELFAIIMHFRQDHNAFFESRFSDIFHHVFRKKCEKHLLLTHTDFFTH